MPMTAELTAAEICSLLDLEPNATCGSTRVSFVSQLSIAAGGLPAPFADGRPLGSALYFLVTPGSPVRLHRIRNEQLYHYYLGDPLEVFMLHADGSSERVIVGSWAEARNGRASCRLTSRSARSMCWLRAIPPSPRIYAPLLTRCSTTDRA